MNLLLYPNFLKNPLNLVRMIYSFICLLPFVKELHFKNFKGEKKQLSMSFCWLIQSFLYLYIYIFISASFFWKESIQ